MCLRFQFCPHQRVCVLLFLVKLGLCSSVSQFLKKGKILCTLRCSPSSKATRTGYLSSSLVMSSLLLSLSLLLSALSHLSLNPEHQQPFLTYRHFSSFSLNSRHSCSHYILSLYTLSFPVSLIIVFFFSSIAMPSLSLSCFSFLSLILSLFFLLFFVSPLVICLFLPILFSPLLSIFLTPHL